MVRKQRISSSKPAYGLPGPSSAWQVGVRPTAVNSISKLPLTRARKSAFFRPTVRGPVFG